MKTPLTILDESILKNNIYTMQTLLNQHSKLLMPMMKTHKSTTIAKMQMAAGCYGFLCGTIDECVAAFSINAYNIMYAYPVSNSENLNILSKLSKHCNMMLRTDSYECADLAQIIAKKNKTCFEMSVIVDSGLHRFGMDVYNAAKLAVYINKLENVKFIGFSTHPGHVYANTADQVIHIAKEECECLRLARLYASNNGVECKYITSGSTPTIRHAISDDIINVFHPGNYVFNDYIQMVLGSAQETDCALYVMASVISNPAEGVFIIDAGAKCLGLDKGAHGNTAIKGYGYIIKHPDAVITSLSEEVGIINAGKEEFKIGDIVRIIPNHSCSTANLTSRLYCSQDGNISDEYIKTDIRGSSYNFKV